MKNSMCIMKKGLIVSTLFGCLLLFGCNLSNNETNTVTEQKKNAVNVEFSWWGNDERHKYTMEAVDLFEESNIDIDIVERYGEWSGYERKNRVWMESNNNADVMQINYAWISEYSEDGNGYYDLYKLSDYIDLSSFDETDLAFGEVNGKLNAIPIAYNTSTVCYNKTLFEKYNLDYPKDWNDLFSVAKFFRKNDIYVVGMSKKHIFLMLIANFEQTQGKRVFDEDGKIVLTKDEVGIILDYYKKLIDEHVVMPVEEFDRGKFGKGICAASVCWISDADNYCKALTENGYDAEIGSFFMDEDAKQSGLYMKPATMYAISDITEHPEEAAKFLDYLINSENMACLQGTEKGVPVSKKALQTLKENNQLDSYGYKAYEKMLEVKDCINIMIPMMESEDLIDTFKSGADTYIYDVATREQALDEIYEGIKSYVK